MLGILGLAALAFVSTATTCSTLKAIAVAPAAEASLDSAGRVAIALVERVTARRGLKPHDPGEAFRAGREGVICFASRGLIVCGNVKTPEVQFSLTEVGSIGFTPWADSVHREVMDSLRVEFGASRVRECEWEAPRRGCPPLAPRDSG